MQSPSARTRRGPRAARVNPFPADETALPGHLLVLLSRLHRAETAAAELADQPGPAQS
ncbi:hypothetical protein [Methylobacterium nodulans]|uniref:hypothetical protein n=1 Tax=Methylobacterium nodulans TaxID=114616 RepID=UPI0002E61639|nr:hypothetical protein [Methylobacterium nodulans]